MAVFLKDNKIFKNIDVSVTFDPDSAIVEPSEAISFFSFSSGSNSAVSLLNNTYNLDRIHVTHPLHKFENNKEVQFELVLECICKMNNHKLFICRGIQIEPTKKAYFPLTNETIKDIFCSNDDSDNMIYKSKNNFVMYRPGVLQMSSRLNKFTDGKSPCDAYREIFDDFICANTVEIPSDRKTQISASKMNRFGDTRRVSEGFLTGDGTYMECKLLKEDAKDSSETYEDVAIVPLSTNVYERGMVGFSYFLNFFIVTVGAGLGFPNLIVTLFNKQSFYDTDEDGTSVPNSLRTIIGYFSFVLFFILGFILVIVGLTDPRFKGAKANYEPLPGSTLFLVGFHLILVHCSFALGMWTFKRFGKTLSSDFETMFTRPNDSSGAAISPGWAHFFDVLSDLKEM